MLTMPLSHPLPKIRILMTKHEKVWKIVKGFRDTFWQVSWNASWTCGIECRSHCNVSFFLGGWGEKGSYIGLILELFLIWTSLSVYRNMYFFILFPQKYSHIHAFLFHSRKATNIIMHFFLVLMLVSLSRDLYCIYSIINIKWYLYYIQFRYNRVGAIYVCYWWDYIWNNENVCSLIF